MGILGNSITEMKAQECAYPHKKYNSKNLFLISPDSCICFQKKAGQICVEKQEHFVL